LALLLLAIANKVLSPQIITDKWDYTYMKNIFKQTILIMSALFLVMVNIRATVFTNLYSFKAASINSLGFYTNNGGANPYAGLILSSNNMYGTTYQGGTNGSGTVFKVNTDGMNFITLHNFSVLISGTNYDGAKSFANLVISSNTLYGTTYKGGIGGNGTIFKVNTDGTGFTNLYSFSANPNFTNSDGASASSSLVLSGNILYGTAVSGGSAGNGVVFKISTDGMSFTNLHNFTVLNNTTNTDGANPDAKLDLLGNTLYGTTFAGGGNGEGNVFKVNTDGSGFTNLYSFTALVSATNNDGANPQTALVLSNNILYGTTQHGGSEGEGTVFKINIDGTHFTNLYNFTSLNNNTNGDGAGPVADLVLSGTTLYGTTPLGGSGGNGTMFAINTDGTYFTNLYSFSALISGTNNDGAYSTAFLALSDNTLYGTASGGGIAGWGTMFALNLPAPNLNIQLISGAAILSWSNPAFSLQAAPTVTGIYTNVLGTSPYTNAFNGSQQFFRLQAN
jgi:uncharacterized repeat protein (TIGR03803 family)